MPDEFISAKPSAALQGFFRHTLPLILPRLGVVGVDYDTADLDRLRALKDERVLLTPNHPTNTEPALLFHLSAAVRQPFLYLACREAFEPLGGLWGEVIRRVGAFSVVRGTADRASFRATRELLAQPASKVVIFPEGEVYSQNDSLLPFHSGVFQLAFWALEDLHKAGHEDASLFIQPVAIKYVFTRDMWPEVDASLARLERFTGVPATPGEDRYRRLRHIGAAMLRSLEREYRLPTPKDDKESMPGELTPRLDAIKEAILQRVAAAAGVAVPKGETLPERMRALIHVVETVTGEEPHEATPYDTELRRQQRARATPLLRDLRRLANWIAVHDGYVAADPTPERMADMLVRLERECFGEAKLHGPRRCRVRLAEPLDLKDCWPAYQTGKRAEVQRVAREVEGRVAALLTSAGGGKTTAPLNADGSAPAAS
jgi:1-acyl-sn-glycerol-3-phosphate acyltransferase